MAARISCCLWMFPISDRNPDLMEKFAHTDTETLLWDYSETEEHYVLVIPPARRVKTLYRVTQVYAYQWFGINGGNNLKIAFYPFAQTHFRDLPDNPCDCPPESVEIFASISVSPTSVLEDSGTPMIYTVTLDTASLYDTTVNFTLTGTATEGVDYTAVTHSVFIAAEQTTGTFAIHPIADASLESDETVIATLVDGSSGVNVIVISIPTATGTIINDDMSSVMWDPLSVENVVLSNSNLTNTNTGNRNDNFDAQGAKVTGVLSSGKHYFEITYNTQKIVGIDGLALGIGSAGGNYDGFNYAAGAYGAAIYTPENFVIYADSLWSTYTLTTQGSTGNGDVFGIAVDLDAGKVWFQIVGGPDVDPVNGWNGINADPVAGTGGVVIPPGLKTIFGTFSDGDDTEALTLNLGTSAFSGTVPTGYTAGWPSTAFVPSVTGATWGSLTATNVTLSNSDLTATNNLDGPGFAGGAIGTVGSSFGQRLYFEITCTNPGGHILEHNMMGLGDNINDIYVHFGTLLASGGVAVDNDGVLWSNGTETTDVMGHFMNAGDVIGVAWDTVSNHIWFGGVGGSIANFGQFWVGRFATSSPPVFPGTNCQGASMPGGSTKYPIVAWNDFDNTQVATFNFTGPFVGNPMVTWGNPFTSVGGTATRSNGNLTVTSTNGNPVAVKSTGGQLVQSPNFGSWWFEITLGATYAGTTTSCGLCNYLFDGGLCLLVGNQGLDCFSVDVAGKFWFHNNGFIGSGATAVTLAATLPGDVLQFAVKIGTTSQIWVRINRGGVPQDWNGNPTASPFPASGGFDITAVFNNADVLNAPFVFQGFNSNGSSSTANFGQSTFVTNPPIFPAWGNTFTPWGGTLDPVLTRDTTLSNGNLTATNNYPAAVAQGVTVTTASGKTSGKYYFEITITIDMDGDAIMGVAPIGTDYSQFALDAVGGVGCYAGGGIYSNGTYTGLSVSLSQVDRVGVAVDLDNRMVWFMTVDGSDYYQPDSWNGLSIGDADPATNLNGIPLVAGTIVPIAAFCAREGDDAGNTLTINTGQTPFAALVPVGFTAGWPA